MNRAIIHIDLDAFFASVEQRDNPSLRGKPVIVGGKPNQRGVVSAASYEARKFGVHSAMPLSQAHRFCPRGIFLPVNMSKYQEVSAQIMKIFEKFTPVLEVVSLDEAFLDVFASQKLFGTPVEICRKIKKAVFDNTGLTASAGLAPNKLLAKMASDINKPDGFVEVRNQGSPEKPDYVFYDLSGQKQPSGFSALPVKKLWGVGPSTENRLKSLGIETIGDLAETPVEVLKRRLGRTGEYLAELARGSDDSPVETVHSPKSIGQETTFPKDVRDMEYVRKTLLGLSEEVGRSLRQEKLLGRTITVKIRYADFTTITRSQTLSFPTDLDATIAKVASDIFQSAVPGSPSLRLIGVTVSNIVSAESSRQLSLFGEEEKKARDLMSAVDRIRKRYGDRSIKRLTNL